MKKYNPIDCPVCGNKSFTLLFQKSNEDFVKCVDCNLIYINPQPSGEVLNNTYNDNYADLYIKKSKSKYKRSYRRVKKLIQLNSKAQTFLDIGSSAGFVVKAAKDLGLNAYGVEIEKTGPKYAKEILGLDKIYNTFLEDAHFENQKFDIITFYEVLEHIPNPNKFLQEVHRILHDEGIIGITVPNVGHWTIRHKIETWSAIIPSEHLWYFDKNTLKTLFEKNRFETISIKQQIFKTGLKAIFRKKLTSTN